jgi:hypothetical protein
MTLFYFFLFCFFLVFFSPTFFFHTFCAYISYVFAFLLQSYFFYLFIELELNHVHHYCGHLLACCTSPVGQMVMTVVQLVE